MDISQMTLEQLKALAYDQIVLLNQTQANINILQAEIKKREDEKNTPPPVAPPAGV